MDKKQENGLSPERTEQLRALLLALESKMKHLQANEDFAALSDEVMPSLSNQNLCAQSRRPSVMTCHGSSLFQASQQ